MPGTRTARAANAARLDADDESVVRNAQPLACADALARTAAECARQHERLAALIHRDVGRAELTAAHALVDTVDLALEEAVSGYENACRAEGIDGDDTLRKAANALWHASREYLRRASIAEKASRQLRTHDADTLNDLQLEYELEASALLGMRHATSSFLKLRPDAAV
jgi:hypothetical protein